MPLGNTGFLPASPVFYRIFNSITQIIHKWMVEICQRSKGKIRNGGVQSGGFVPRGFAWDQYCLPAVFRYYYGSQI